MKIRNLKIAVSVASVLACVLLLVLWVRSHWVCESFVWNGWRRIAVWSGYGQLRVTERNPTNPDEPLLKWHLSGYLPDGIGSWYFQRGHHHIFLVIPHRFPIVVFILLAALPWIHWRYSLRALLIGLTVVALVLGLLFAF